jgi:SMC interacting uncharacterized protein involved in chromosome segregation
MGYEPDSRQDLLNPTARGFVGIVNFLLGKLHPDYEIEGRLDEAIPAIFREFHYPWDIKKESL